MTDIKKAVVSTPLDEKGHFDSGKLTVGDSAWITVGAVDSPLRGRHLLVVKRPDNLLAIIGGGGISTDSETEARRHIVLTGTPRRTKRDDELIAEAAKADEYNQPLVEAKRKLEQESRAEIRQAADAMLSALGVEKVDTKKLLSQKDEVQKYVEKTLGEGQEEQAKRLTDTIMRQVVASNRQVTERVQRERQVVAAKIGKRLAAFEDAGQTPAPEQVEQVIQDAQEEIVNRDAVVASLPNLEEIKDLPAEQQESVIANHFEQQADSYFEEDRLDVAVPEDAPKIVLGETIKPLEIKSEEHLHQAVDSVQQYWTKRKEAELQAARIKKIPLTVASPSTIAEVVDAAKMTGVEMTPDELAQRVDNSYEKWVRDHTALAFYDAVGEYWNDNKSLVDQLQDSNRMDSTMAFHVNAGAATAIAALAKEYLGLRLDTAKLIEASNVDVAAASLALQLRQKYANDVSGYDVMVQKVREFNAHNQAETERRALDRHKVLDQQYREIQRQKVNAELLDKVKIASLETQSVLEQRKNLGSALGSLQTSATFYDYLTRFRTAKNDAISINVGGSQADAEALLKRLRVTKNYSVDTSDPNNVTVRLGLLSLEKLVTLEKDLKTQFDKYDALKTDMSGISVDSRGNTIADKYDVPFFKDRFVSEAGEEQEYHWRVEQRNDINWLLETTKKTDNNPMGQGGGLITRTTGAGKSNSALGFYAHKLDEDPEYKGLIVVPRGRAEQWLAEAKRFTSLPVEVIPDGTAKDKVDDILLNSKPGTIYVMGHREAARSSEMVSAIQSSEKLKAFDGLVIDEPQELQARGQSGSIGSLGRRLMKIPVKHRIGLTATPARRNPLEVYDLIKWTSGGKEIGSKASFNRIFSGFGSGTNAQDSAIRELYFKTIQPFISGDRISVPTFKVTKDDVAISRTPEQVAKQKDIEAKSADFIQQRKQQYMADAQSNLNHPLRRGDNWQMVLPRKALAWARRDLESQHQENMDAGNYKVNGKLQALRDNLIKAADKKHAIFIDSRMQRAAVMEMLRDVGLKPNQVKNLAATTSDMTGAEMARRAKEFQTDKNVKVVLLDTKSSSGYNLQAGDELHVIGAPSDAAVYMQVQGRLARAPRKGDVKVLSYRYADNPVEQARWLGLDNELKLLRASAPGLFVGQEEK